MEWVRGSSIPSSFFTRREPALMTCPSSRSGLAIRDRETLMDQRPPKQGREGGPLEPENGRDVLIRSF